MTAPSFWREGGATSAERPPGCMRTARGRTDPGHSSRRRTSPTVDSLASEWGVERDNETTEVWFKIGR